MAQIEQSDGGKKKKGAQKKIAIHVDFTERHSNHIGSLELGLHLGRESDFVVLVLLASSTPRLRFLKKRCR